MRKKKRGSCLGLLLRWVIFIVAVVYVFSFIYDKLKEREFEQIKKFEETIENLVEQEQVNPKEKLEQLEGKLSHSEGQYYFYEQLDQEEKIIYLTILEGLLEEKTSILLETTDEQRLQDIRTLVHYEHPELHWVEGNWSYIKYGDSIEYQPAYLPVDKEQRDQQMEQEWELFMEQFDENASDYEKVKNVYEYVIRKVEYVEESSDNQNVYSALVNKQSVCSGYAKAVQYLLQKVGMECLYVVGTVNDGTHHAWNIVQCNGCYYQVDATYGDRVMETVTDSEVLKVLEVNYSYLCCEDELIYAERTPNMPAELPVCHLDNLNYFKQMGHFYEQGTTSWEEDLEDSVFAGERIWQCQFADEEGYEHMLQCVEQNVYADIVKEYLTDQDFYGEYTMFISSDDQMKTIILWYSA